MRRNLDATDTTARRFKRCEAALSRSTIVTATLATSALATFAITIIAAWRAIISTERARSG